MLLIRYRSDVVERGFVAHVLDGDGVILDSGDGRHVVRLYGIDAPERNQMGGRAARTCLEELVKQRDVTVRRYGTCFYGRLVADLEVEGVGRVSVAMVRAGWAWWFKRVAHDDVALRDAELEARGDRRGVWAEVDPTPPWLWRRRRVPRAD
jgi:endonuclease YncB( thermonuclease family)